MKIAYIVPVCGCSWWRCLQPAFMLEKLGLAEVKVLETTSMSENDGLDEILSWGEVIVQQSSMDIPAVVFASKLIQLGKTVITDYDDLTFSVVPFNPAYKTLGLREVKVRDKDGTEKFLFEDGKDGFSIKANYFRYKSLQDLLRILSGVTTTCKYIKDRYKEFNSNIFILPNSINFNIFRPFPKYDTGRVRIGWTASDSHYSEIWMVKRIMRRIINKYKEKVVFVELGNIEQLQFEFNPNEMEMHPWVPLATYPLKFATLNLDIGICPLDDNDFNRGKSQLKWSEYAAMKIPSICSNLEPYSCVEDGRTGMLAKDEDEFFEKLCTMIDDKILREKMADCAYDKNYEDFNLEKNAPLWFEAYTQVREKSELPLLDKEALESDTLRI